MKFLVSLNNKKDIDTLINLGIDSFLIGVENFSLYQNVYFKIEEIKKLVLKYKKVDFFVSVNKLIHNNDLKELKIILKELEKLPLKGVLYDDFAILNLYKKENLIWAASHFVTSYHAINATPKRVVGALISPEITLDEILEIRKNTSKKLITYGFGYLPMTTSKRTLLSNYLKEIKEPKTDGYYIKDKKHNYPIIEDDSGTHIYTGSILDTIQEIENLDKNKIDYLYLNGINIDDNKYIEIIKRFIKAIKKQKDINIDDLIQNNSSLFLYKESFFKVGEKND